MTTTSSFYSYYEDLNKIEIPLFEEHEKTKRVVLNINSSSLLNHLLFLYQHRNEKETIQILDIKRLIIEQYNFNLGEFQYEYNEDLIYKTEKGLLHYLNSNDNSQKIELNEEFYTYNIINQSKLIFNNLIIDTINQRNNYQNHGSNYSIYVSPFKKGNFEYNISISKLINQLMIFMPSSMFYLFPNQYWNIITYSFMIRSIIMNTDENFSLYSIQNNDTFKLHTYIPDLFKYSSFKSPPLPLQPKKKEEEEPEIFGVNMIDEDINVFKKQLFQLRNMMIYRENIDSSIIDNHFKTLIDNFNTNNLPKKNAKTVSSFELLYTKITDKYIRAKVLINYIITNQIDKDTVLKLIKRPGESFNNVNKNEEREDDKKIKSEYEQLLNNLKGNIHHKYVTYYGEYNDNYPEFNKLYIITNLTDKTDHDFIQELETKLNNENIYLVNIEKVRNGIYLVTKSNTWNIPIGFHYLPLSNKILDLNITKEGNDSFPFLIINHGNYYKSFIDLLKMICINIEVNITFNLIPKQQQKQKISSNILIKIESKLSLDLYLKNKLIVFVKSDIKDKDNIVKQYYKPFINYYINSNIDDQIYRTSNFKRDDVIQHYFQTDIQIENEEEIEGDDYINTLLIDTNYQKGDKVKSIIFNLVLSFDSFILNFNSYYERESINHKYDKYKINDEREVDYQLINLNKDNSISSNIDLFKTQYSKDILKEEKEEHEINFNISDAKDLLL